MRADWFRPTVLSWSDTLAWGPDDLRRATRLLKAISIENGGSLFVDENISGESARAYAICRVELALQAHASLLAKNDQARSDKLLTFVQHIAQIADTGSRLGQANMGKRRPEELVLEELAETLNNLRENPSPLYRHRRATRASKAMKYLDRLRRAASTTESNVCDYTEAIPIVGRDYLPMAVKMIKNAKSSILVSMFFFHLLRRSSYPTWQLANALVEARKRGLDIRVLLDKDTENDVYKSHLINKNAFSFLTEHDIMARYRSGSEVNHFKCLISDKTFMLTGSHNWTAGALENYDEVSTYLESSEAADRFSKKFEELWLNGATQEE